MTGKETTTWLTHEAPPRRLIVKGRSGIDPDCLVAHLEGDDRPLWIVDDGEKTENAYVTGIDVHASMESTHGQ